MKSSLIITIALLLLYIISVLCLAKECTNTPSQLSSHTFRNALLQSKNESLKTEMFSHYHLTPTDDTAWSSLLPRKMLREEEDEYGWTMMYRKIKNSDSFLKEVSLHDVRLDPNTFHWRAQQTNLEYLLMLDVDSLAWSFRKAAGLDAPGSYYGGWERPDSELRGHFVGHYLSATAYMWASTHNNTLKEKMSALVSALSTCQQKLGTGYLSAFPSSFFDRAEPPLRKEVVEYMLDVDSHMWSMRRSKANFFRIMNVLSGLVAVTKWFDQICHWRNPITTVLIHVLFIILVLYPELILPTVFLYLFLIGIWNFRWRPRHPPHMDTRLSHADAVHPDELDEEFDTFPTSRSPAIVRMRYDRLRSIGGRVQTVIGDLATQGERFLSLLSWRDPRATTLFLFFCLIAAVVLYVTPFQVVALLTGIYLLRHPRFRHKLPSVPLNLFRRLPARSDSLI
ncbi:hypothetical protein F2Q70_00007360 [Brassica cretica]|uniref:Phosphoribosyltransferase C-terminal domain-containing protein n=1 Tax=Brassica cretica TaxID=69181 RepID=A0A8S9M8L8_BRACR|nr:hypothetical protein F2Q70_00007360 [Brassica cretica]